MFAILKTLTSDLRSVQIIYKDIMQMTKHKLGHFCLSTCQHKQIPNQHYADMMPNYPMISINKDTGKSNNSCDMSELRAKK